MFKRVFFIALFVIGHELLKGLQKNHKSQITLRSFRIWKEAVSSKIAKRRPDNCDRRLY